MTKSLCKKTEKLLKRHLICDKYQCKSQYIHQKINTHDQWREPVDSIEEMNGNKQHK